MLVFGTGEFDAKVWSLVHLQSNIMSSALHGGTTALAQALQLNGMTHRQGQGPYSSPCIMQLLPLSRLCTALGQGAPTPISMTFKVKSLVLNMRLLNF